MYGSFEDFARYANDREMDSFGTQEFFDYHNAKRVADAGQQSGLPASREELAQKLSDAINQVNDYLVSLGRPPIPPPPPEYIHPSPPDTSGHNPFWKSKFWGGIPFSDEGDLDEPGGEQRIPDATLTTPDVDPLNLQMSPTLSVPAVSPLNLQMSPTLSAPADIAPLLEQSMGPVGEGVKVAAADTGTMSDAISGTMPNVISDSTRASINKLIARIPDNKDAVKTWEPTSLKDQYRLSLRDGLIALGFDEHSATRLANNVIGEQYLGYKGEGGLSSFKGGIRSLGVGDFEPVAVTHGGVQAIRRGLESGDNFEVAGGVLDMLFGGLPVYGKPLANAVRGVIDVLGKRFGKTGPEAAKLDSAAGSLETPNGVVQQRIVPLKPSSEIESDAMGAVAAGTTKAPVTQTSRRIRGLREKLEAGKITDDAFVDGVTKALNEQGVSREIGRLLRPIGRTQGHEWVKSWLNRAAAEGAVPPDAVALYEFMANKNPRLAESLSVSIRAIRDPDTGAVEKTVGGDYNPASMLMRINSFFSKRGIDLPEETIAHEFLHHTERMLPEAARDAISRQWYINVAKRFAKTKDPELKLMYETILNGDIEKARKMYSTISSGRGASMIAEYQFVSPSEWWAENGARILKSQKDATGIKGKTLGWYKEIMSFAKDKIGFASDYPAYAALNKLVKSDGGISGKMIQERPVPAGSKETGWQNIGKAGAAVAAGGGAYAAIKDKERK